MKKLLIIGIFLIFGTFMLFAQSAPTTWSIYKFNRGLLGYDYVECHKGQNSQGGVHYEAYCVDPGLISCNIKRCHTSGLIHDFDIDPFINEIIAETDELCFADIQNGRNKKSIAVMDEYQNILYYIYIEYSWDYDENCNGDLMILVISSK